VKYEGLKLSMKSSLTVLTGLQLEAVELLAFIWGKNGKPKYWC